MIFTTIFFSRVIHMAKGGWGGRSGGGGGGSQCSLLSTLFQVFLRSVSLRYQWREGGPRLSPSMLKKGRQVQSEVNTEVKRLLVSLIRCSARASCLSIPVSALPSSPCRALPADQRCGDNEKGVGSSQGTGTK